MSGLKNKPLRLLCDFERLGPDARSAWLVYLGEWVANAGHAVEIIEAPLPDLNEVRGDVAFISSSGALTRKLINTCQRVFIKPAERVQGIDTWLYNRLEHVPDGWFCQQFDVSLITSVYAGDEYLDGFLENSSRLDGYDRCQHLLVRAGSPGCELDQLVDFVQAHPNAVLINLEQDPGLYEVWNYAARLSTAKHLSNANLDDRRAPEHIAKLVQVLKANPGIDVASSALRVSLVKNLRWEDSAGCEVWPKDPTSGAYSGAELFRYKGNELASRNLPHCMPVWRRSVHGWAGDFDEKVYGPSADWAFWLNAAAAGAGFCFEAEPLGLYLKTASGYWQRLSGESGQSAFDAKIAADFAELAYGLPCAEAELPLSLHWAIVARRLEAGAVLDALTYLLEKCPVADEASADFPVLLGRYHFGLGFCHDLVARYQALRQHVSTGALLNALVDLINGQQLEAVGSPSGRAPHNLSLVCTDWLETYSDQRGYMLSALLAKRCGDVSKEQTLLKRAYALDAKKFWYQIQSVYRFESPLPDLVGVLEDCGLSLPRGTDQPANLYYYPNATGNTYLTLLYSSLEGGANQVQPLNRLGQIRHAEYLDGYENIIHVHWINELIRAGVTQEDREDFLATLRECQARGFKIYWTVHNYVSHDCTDEPHEILFRQALYRLVDRVFVHHPLAMVHLDWLPDSNKVSLCEHGMYRCSSGGKVSARQALGLSESDLLITTIGRVKPYKGLLGMLPLVRDALESCPRMKFALLGKIDDERVKDWLKAHPHDRMIIVDERLDEALLKTWMSASDMGLLSYEKILTSGAMFHWFSMGRPVLAPTKGQIPAYVVNGWNGYLYESGAQLTELLGLIARGGEEFLKEMAANAKLVASRLEWGRVI